MCSSSLRVLSPRPYSSSEWWTSRSANQCLLLPLSFEHMHLQMCGHQWFLHPEVPPAFWKTSRHFWCQYLSWRATLSKPTVIFWSWKTCQKEQPFAIICHHLSDFICVFAKISAAFLGSNQRCTLRQVLNVELFPRGGMHCAMFPLPNERQVMWDLYKFTFWWIVAIHGQPISSI